MAALPGGRLASGSFDGAIKLWDLATMARNSAPGLAERGGPDEAPRHLRCLAVLEGGRLASGGLCFF